MPTDTALLQAALVGYQAEKEKIENAIAEIRKQLGGWASGGKLAASARTRKPMSAAARKRIAAAQKKRWAAFRKGKKAA